uniref:F-box domain-containing protein n=1 Tax=Strigamia maritima TaxID=126957 RepID=T1JLR5_STRMM
MERNGIENLPEEVFEYILSLLSPYRDLKNCMCVCRAWRKYIKDVVRRMQHDFQRAIIDMNIDWRDLTPDPGPTITKRYSHSACCIGSSMYIFGGCTTTSTTFNDLWRLDLANREWIRPLATGTYPSPKACATMVVYDDNLVLFGGWTHPSPYPLHQAWRLFNQLHIFSPMDNRWTLIPNSVPATSRSQPPGMAGHSATVHGDLMVVFGGLQRQSNGRPYTSANDLWVLNLKSMLWKKQETNVISPRPRYGQSQVYLDQFHALIIGGCGGPNMVYNDIWLLSMDDESIWKWTQLTIRCSENAAPHLWCRPACRVGDKVIILSRSLNSKTTPTSLSGQMLRPAISRINLNTGESPSPASGTKDNCVNGKRGTFRKPLVPKPFDQSEASTSQGFGLRVEDDSKTFGHDSPSNSRTPQRNSPLPSVRINPMANRERQLEGLRRMEERIKNLSKRQHVVSPPIPPPQPSPSNLKMGPRNPMTLYVVDISQVLNDYGVTWLPPRGQSQGPEDTSLYTLVIGRGELIMFGGIHKDPGMAVAGNGNSNVPESVSNSVHFLRARKWVI